MIRENIPQHMEELKAWLQETEDDRLEDMAGFFRVRLDGYEDHMAIWKDAYLEMERRLPDHVETLLDLGCGTGLELDAILAKRPHLCVTGIDLCPQMLAKLHQKHPQVQTVCADYFRHDLGEDLYDAVINFETLHHFTPEAKAGLYKNIHRALRPGGCYLQAEYVACCAEEETLLWDTFRRKKQRDGIPDGTFVHFDAPLTLEHELALLRGAGFKDAHSPISINGACFIAAYRT